MKRKQRKNHKSQKYYIQKQGENIAQRQKKITKITKEAKAKIKQIQTEAKSKSKKQFMQNTDKPKRKTKKTKAIRRFNARKIKSNKM